MQLPVPWRAFALAFLFRQECASLFNPYVWTASAVETTIAATNRLVALLEDYRMWGGQDVAKYRQKLT